MPSAILSSIVQVLVFILIPFIFYVIAHRHIHGFATWIGLYAPKRQTMRDAGLLVLVMSPILLLVFYAPGLHAAATDPATVSGHLRAAGLSISTLVQLVVYAGVQTALSEEILFRGFIAKRLITWLGFTWGNIWQALIFGVLHFFIIIAALSQRGSLLTGIVIGVLISLIGWFLGFINERRGNGSIIPSWSAHAISNLLAYSLFAFVLH